ITSGSSSADLSSGEAAAGEAELLERAGRGSRDHASVLLRMAPHQRRDGADMSEGRLEPPVLFGVADHECSLRAEPGQAVATKRPPIDRGWDANRGLEPSSCHRPNRITNAGHNEQGRGAEITLMKPENPRLTDRS